MDSSHGAIHESTTSQGGVESPSQTAYPRRECMMPPDEKLCYFESRAQAMADNQQFDGCISDLVRCVALARLLHGEEHVKLAQAHARLAEAYLQFKGWGEPAHEHAALARELLLYHRSAAPAASSQGTSWLVLTWLLRNSLTHGGAALLTDHLKEAEVSYLDAARLLDELYEQGGITQEEKSKTKLQISTALSRLYQRQGKLGEALVQCEMSVQLLGDQGAPDERCSVYRDMAAIERSRGFSNRAIEHLTKAHAIAVSQSPGGQEGAHISHSLAMVHSTVAEPHHNESAAHYFEESLEAYRNSLGPQDATFLAVQDDFCHFLLINGHKERCVEIQKTSLAPKRSTFGDWSAEVADSLQLIGAVEMTQGRLKQALRAMRKCLEIQNSLYGPQHKKTKATQKTVDMLQWEPDVASRQL